MSVSAVAEHVRAAPPRCGSTRIVAIDGRSGSGKSTFARALSTELDDAPLLELERIYPGWDGLERGLDILVSAVLEPLCGDRTALVPQWDWTTSDWGPTRPIAPAPVLILEGVGAGAQRVTPHLSTLVWLEADTTTRKTRALARDGATYEPYWDIWATQEETLLARESIASRADLVIPT